MKHPCLQDLIHNKSEEPGKFQLNIAVLPSGAPSLLLAAGKIMYAFLSPQIQELPELNDRPDNRHAGGEERQLYQTSCLHPDVWEHLVWR